MSPDRLAVARDCVEKLFKLLAPVGSEFPVEERKRWLEAVSAMLILGYGVEGEIKITIEPKPDL